MELDRIYNEDCLSGLKKLPDNSVDCCVTSPPYYALRDYGCDGQIGLEETPQAYIDRLTEVFMEVHRVLKPEGTLWVNIGDSYCGTGDKGDWKDPKNPKGRNGQAVSKTKVVDGCKQKDLIGIPWMLAFSLRNAGWYLRQDIIWHKPNPMPESVKDRCTKSHEYIFLMSKSKKYYFDNDSILEPCSDQTRENYQCGSRSNGINKDRNDNDGGERSKSWKPKKMPKFDGNKYGDNDDKHFQTYSDKEWKPRTKNCQYDGQTPNTMHIRRELGEKDEEYIVRNKRDVWSVNVKPDSVAHFATYPEELIIPCILAGCPSGGVVLDPFMGSGTTARVARRLNRHFVGFELNPEYCKIIEKKIQVSGDLFY